MATPTTCRRCGSTSSGEWSGELCAACLLEFAWLDYEPAAQAESARAEVPEETSAPTTFAGYQVLGELASGGMGVVYRALQVNLNRPVALKMIRAGRLARPEDRARFRAEAETAAQLQHPNIVAIHEVGEQAGQPFFSMELIEGWSLAEMVRQHPLRPDQAARYVRTIAEAIHFAHERGVLHRDLKPSNVLVDGNDEPHVTDFGLAKIMADDSGLTHTGAVLGSPSYMAPEQARGRNDALDVRTDVYALGAILYELLTGRPPFRASSAVETLRLVAEEEPVPPRALNPGLPRDLETICLQCLAKAPEARYASARELGEELGRFLEDRPIHARPAGIGEKLVRWCRREPVLAAALGCVLLLFTALAGVSGVAAMRLKKEAAVTRAAREVAEERLLAAELQRAHAERLSGTAGRRQRALAAIQAAARVRPSLALRNEAIAALALADLGPPLMERPNTERLQGNFMALDGEMSRYALAQQGEKVVIHRASDHAVLGQFPAPSQPPAAVRFSPSGRYLAEDDGESGLSVWDLARGVVVFRTDRRAKGVRSGFAAGTEDLGLVGADFRVHLHALPGGVRRRTLASGAQPLWLAFGPKAENLAVGCADQVQLWNAATGQLERVLHPPARSTCLAWHEDGQHVVLGLVSGEVMLWDLVSDQRTTMAAHAAEVLSVGFDPAGEAVWSSGSDGMTRFWDAVNGSLLLTTWDGLVHQMSRDGNRVAYWIWDNSFGVWPVLRSESFRTLRTAEDEAELLNVSLSADGRWLVAGASSGWHLLDTSTGLEAGCVRLGRRVRMAMAPDGRSVAGVTLDEVLRWPLAWRTNAGRITVQVGPAETLLAAPGKELQRISYSADGTLLVVAGHHRNEVMDLAHGGMTTAFSRGVAQSFASVSPDHRWIAAADVFGRGATLWDRGSGEMVRTLVARDRAHVVFSPDGRTLATMAKECVFWNTADWQPRWSIPLEAGFVGSGSVAFSGDGAFLGVVDRHQLVKLFSPETGRELATLTPPTRLNLAALDISADGGAVAAVTQGRTVYFWNVRALRRELAGLGLDW